MCAVKRTKTFNNWVVPVFFILVLNLAVYGQILDFGFLTWDDNINIYGNPDVIGFHWDGISGLFNSKYEFTLIPTLVWGMLFKYFDGSPQAFHFFNLLFSFFNGVLVFILARQFFTKSFFAFLAAAIFVLHPVHVEVVAWSSGSKDLLLGFFFLLSVISFVNYLRNDKFLLLIACLIFALLSSFCKIQAVALGPCLLLFLWVYRKPLTLQKFLMLTVVVLLTLHRFNAAWQWFLIMLGWMLVLRIVQQRKDALLIRILPQRLIGLIKNIINEVKVRYRLLLWIFIPALLLLSAAYFVNQPLKFWDTENNIFSFNMGQRVFMAGYSFLYYLFSIPFPLKMVAMHPYPDFGPDQNHWPFIAAVSFAIAISISVLLLFWKKKISREVMAAFLFFVVNISLVLHLIPIQGRLIVADRYNYLAGAGLIMILVAAISKAINAKKWLFILISVVPLVLLAANTYSYTRNWKSSEKLYAHIISCSADASYALNNRGILYKEFGDLQLAVKDFQNAIRVSPAYAEAYYNLGLTYLELGHAVEAVTQFNQAIRFSKKPDPEMIASRGWAKFQSGNPYGAIADFTQSVRLDSCYALAYNNRGWVWYTLGNESQSLMDVEKAIKLNPQFAQAYNNRGWIKLERNDFTGAMFDFGQAIQISPGFESARMNLAWTLFLMKNFTESASHYRQIFNSNPSNLRARYYLGISLLNLGQSEEACGHIRAAIQSGYNDDYNAGEYCTPKNFAAPAQ